MFLFFVSTISAPGFSPVVAPQSFPFSLSNHPSLFLTSPYFTLPDFPEGQNFSDFQFDLIFV